MSVAKQSSNSDTANKTIRILLVEDSRIVRLGLSTFLGSDPNIDVVAEADSGEEALQIASGDMVFDVAIVDLGLPGISGIEVMAELKKTHPQVQMIVLTSHQQKEEVLASMAAGASAFCLKDISSTDLAYIVKLVHEGGVWLDPQIAKHALEVFDNMDTSTMQENEEAPRMASSLTPRERQVLKYIAEGKNNKEIAEHLYISPHTVKVNVSNILTKLAVQDRVQAAVLAIKNKLV